MNRNKNHFSYLKRHFHINQNQLHKNTKPTAKINQRTCKNQPNKPLFNMAYSTVVSQQLLHQFITQSVQSGTILATKPQPKTLISTSNQHSVSVTKLQLKTLTCLYITYNLYTHTHINILLLLLLVHIYTHTLNLPYYYMTLSPYSLYTHTPILSHHTPACSTVPTNPCSLKPWRRICSANCVTKAYLHTPCKNRTPPLIATHSSL